MQFFKINIIIFNFLMNEGSTSGRRLYIQVWYSVFTSINISFLVGTMVQNT